jgi:uncharacterized protein (DUF934 family)
MLLTLAQWQALRGRLCVPAGTRLGLRLPNDADVAALRDDLPRLSLLALDFPKWTDGRAYSQAVLLRARLYFKGEIRATGEVLADMLPLLRRCGFDAVQLRADQQQATAERALGYFSTHYQSVPPERAPR